MLIPEVGNRKVIYLDIINSLDELENLQLKNWVLFVIEDNSTNPILDGFARLCIQKELLYLATTGEACEQVHDFFDFTMLELELEGAKLPSWYLSEEDVLMTVWDSAFDEGFWFITSVATYEDWPIETVLVANLTDKNYLPRIQELAKQINGGWLPSG